MSNNESQPAPGSPSPRGARPGAGTDRRARKDRLDSLQSTFHQQISELQQLVTEGRDTEALTALQESWSNSHTLQQEQATVRQEQLLEDFAELLGQLRTEREQLERMQARETGEQDGLAGEVRDLRAALESWRVERDGERVSDADERLQELQAENAELQRRIDALESEALNAVSAEDSDLQRRFEMAVRDVRELKQQNQELERELQAARRKGTTVAAPSSSDSGQGLDWESQKRRMLAELETDSAGSQDDKLSIEGTIRITDDVVAEKDALLQELQERLDALTQDGAREAAEHDLLDRDEVISAERSRLRGLQEEWEAKLRKAEIEISVERAKMARERRELEEKMRSLQDELRSEESLSSTDETKGGKSNRRWLARLGLSEQE